VEGLNMKARTGRWVSEPHLWIGTEGERRGSRIQFRYAEPVYFSRRQKPTFVLRRSQYRGRWQD